MKTYKRILIMPFVIVGMALVLCQVPLIRTPLLLSLINYVLQGQGLTVTFSNLSGVFPFNTSWGSITVTDEQDVRIYTKDVEVSWSPWSTNRISATALHLDVNNIELTNIKATIALTAQSVHLKGISTISGVVVEGETVWERETQAGSFKGIAKIPSMETLLFNIPYQLNGKCWHLRNAVVEGEGLEIHGSGILSQEAQEGRLTFRVDQLTKWGAGLIPPNLISIEGDGLTGTVAINQREIIGHIEANHIAWKDLVLVDSQGDYRYSLADKALKSLNFTCEKSQWRDSSLTEIKTQAHQTATGFNIELQAADARTQGKLQLRALVDERHVSISEASYRKDQKNIALKEPIVWYYDELWPRSAIHIKADNGILRVDALKSAEKAKVVLQKFPLNIFSLFMEEWPIEGIVSGTGWLAPAVADCSYELTLKGEDLHFANDKTSPKIYLSATLNGNKDHVQWKLKTTDTPKLQFQSEGGIELATYVLNVKNQGIIVLDAFNKFLSPNDRVAGKMTIQLQVKGSVEHPLMNGQWRIDKGRYEDGDIGLILKHIQVEGQINNSVLTLSQVTAVDVADGSVTGLGTISFQKGWTPFFDLRLDLNKITLAQTDEVKGLASGPIFLKGIGSAAKLFGNLDVHSLAYDFGERKSLPRTIHIDHEDKEAAQKTDTKSQDVHRLPWVPLELVLNFKKPVIIKGEGLNSNWLGNITLGGDLKKSYLVGHLQLLGGVFEFFGKKLKLTAGTMDFDAQAPNDPQITLRAMREAMSLVIYFEIAGRASNPAFSFSSMPPLPTEEIVARLLFDKSLGEMSSMQGLQVASALASLQAASGLNVVNKLRNVFGLDVLEFKESASDPRQLQGQAQGAISLGKQVSDQVYVRAEQGLGADSSKFGVEVKVTPQLSVEADVGGTQSVGAGLNWSMRY